MGDIVIDRSSAPAGPPAPDVPSDSQTVLKRSAPSTAPSLDVYSDISAMNPEGAGAVQGALEERAKKAKQMAYAADQFGSNFDGSNEFGVNSVSDHVADYTMSLLHTPNGQRARFRENYPEGDIIPVPMDNGLFHIARRNPLEKFKIYEGSALSDFASNTATAPMAGTMAAGSLAAKFGFGGPIAGPIAEVGGWLAGRALENTVLSKYEDRTPNVMGGMAEAAGMGLVSVLARGGYIGSLYGAFRKTSYKPSNIDQIQSALDLDLPMYKWAVDPDTFARNTSKQLLVLHNQTRDQSAEMSAGLRQSVIDYANKGGSFSGVDNATLDGLIGDSLDHVDKAMTRFKTEKDAASATVDLRDGLKVFKETTDARAKDLFTASDGLAADSGVQFNLADAKKRISGELSTGPLAEPTEADATGIATRPAVGALKKLMNDIMDSKDIISSWTDPNGSFQNSIQIVRGFRTRAGELMDSEDPQIAGKAQQVYKELSTVMENPIGGSQEFLDANAHSNRYYKNQRAVLDTKIVGDVMNSEPSSYYRLASHLMDPKNYPETIFMRDLISKQSPDKWKEFQAAFSGRVSSLPPQEAIKLLDSYSAEPGMMGGLRALMSEREEQAVRAWATARETALPKYLASQEYRNIKDLASRAIDISNNKDPELLKNLVESTGGQTGKTANDLRAAIADQWSREFEIETQDYGKIFDAKGYAVAVKKILDDKKWDVLFSPADKKWLEDTKNYAIAAGPPVQGGIGEDAYVGSAGGVAGLMAQGQTSKAISAGTKGIIGEITGHGPGLIGAAWQAFKKPVDLAIAAKVMGLNQRLTKIPVNTKFGLSYPAYLNAIRGLSLSTMSAALNQNPSTSD